LLRDCQRAASTRRWTRFIDWRAFALALVVACLLLPSPAAADSLATARKPVPVFAHYYIWFNPSSWNRAKTDYPLLGRYSSDDEKVMRQHIRWAKQAGIDGFIVSWKSTAVLNRRLAQLARLARAESFRLAITYQGLDFGRQPLPVSRVARDLDYLAKTYVGNRSFALFGKPLVIWSGTWRFSREEIASVTRPLKQRLLILASEKSVAGFERVADVVAGDAYYWSSVNPSTHRGYPEKLAAMSAAVHDHGGLWIAPAAPGFDARLVGGRSVVPRRGGETLRREMNTATSSSPDAIGLISWNEFSENSHIEPSQRHGVQYVKVLADLLGTNFTVKVELDSSEPVSTVGYTLPLLVGLGLVGLTGVGAGLWRKHLKKTLGTQG
jgi:glycosyl hydrolase family 71